MNDSGMTDSGVTRRASKRRHHKWSGGKAHFGHRYCSECRTRRGNNKGNRDARRKAKIAIRRDEP